MVAVLAPLSGCSGDVLVELPLHQPAPGGALADIPAANVSVSASAARDAVIGGERTTVGGVKLGDVGLAIDPSETIALLFAAELASAGHRVSSEDAAPRIDVAIETFAARTDATMLYWDVTFDAVVSLEPTGSRYEATATDRTYTNPSGGMITELAEDCLAQLAAQFRDDPLVHAFLRGE